MPDSVLQTICDWLEAANIPFRQVHHEKTLTSQDSARARGEPLRIGGKAMLIKTAETFRLFVLSAELRIDSVAIRKRFGTRTLRFANADELREQTGLVPGSVPPFGRPILPFELFVDPSIVANDRIAFNAGSLTDSIVMSVEDYLKVAEPVVFPFAQQPA